MATPSATRSRARVLAGHGAALEDGLQLRGPGGERVVALGLARQVDRPAVGKAVEELEARRLGEARVHLVVAVLVDALAARRHVVAPRAHAVARAAGAVADEQRVGDARLMIGQAALLATRVAIADAEAVEEREALGVFVASAPVLRAARRDAVGAGRVVALAHHRRAPGARAGARAPRRRSPLAGALPAVARRGGPRSRALRAARRIARARAAPVRAARAAAVRA